MYETTSLPFAGAFTVKLPSTSVIVPVDVPFTKILAPIIGSPFSSVTVPITFVFCAKAATEAISISIHAKIILDRRLLFAFFF